MSINNPSPAPSGPSLKQMPQYAPFLAAVAGILTFGVAPALHQFWPSMPSVDVTTVQGLLGVLLSIAIWLHTVGLQAAVKYFTTTVVPLIVKQLLPLVEAAVAKAVAEQTQLGAKVGALTDQDTHAVIVARLQRQSTKLS